METSERFKKELIKRLNSQGFNLSGEVIITISQVHNENISRQPNCSELSDILIEAKAEITRLHKMLDLYSPLNPIVIKIDNAIKKTTG